MLLRKRVPERNPDCSVVCDQDLGHLFIQPHPHSLLYIPYPLLVCLFLVPISQIPLIFAFYSVSYHNFTEISFVFGLALCIPDSCDIGSSVWDVCRVYIAQATLPST